MAVHSIFRARTINIFAGSILPYHMRTMMALKCGSGYECELGVGRIGGVLEFFRQKPCCFSHIAQTCGRYKYAYACLVKCHIPAYDVAAFCSLADLGIRSFIIYIVMACLRSKIAKGVGIRHTETYRARIVYRFSRALAIRRGIVLLVIRQVTIQNEICIPIISYCPQTIVQLPVMPMPSPKVMYLFVVRGVMMRVKFKWESDGFAD